MRRGDSHVHGHRPVATGPAGTQPGRGASAHRCPVGTGAGAGPPDRATSAADRCVEPAHPDPRRTAAYFLAGVLTALGSFIVVQKPKQPKK